MQICLWIAWNYLANPQEGIYDHNEYQCIWKVDKKWLFELKHNTKLFVLDISSHIWS